MRDSTEPLWGQTEKIGKGTKASYDSDTRVLTFCFNRGPAVTGDLLRKQRERLMKELKELGYDSRMKYNGEVVVENVEETNLVLTKKNGKLVIQVKNRQIEEDKTREES